MPRAVVFGAGGFLGRHLTAHLAAFSWDVVAATRDPTGTHGLVGLQPPSHRITLCHGSLLDREWLAELVKGADAIFPLAGHSGAVKSLNAPEEDLRVNVEAQLLLLEALRVHNPSARVVYPGSRLQYGKCERLPATECTPQRPLSIYGLHKATVESYYRIYHSIHGLRTTVLRISNPYGPFQGRPDKAYGVVGNFISLAQGDRTIDIFGDGSQLRDYVYIEDLVRLFRMCAENDAAIGEVFNASGPAPTPLLAMAQTVLDIIGRGRIAFRPWPPLDAAVETGDYYGSTAKAKQYLGWKSEFSLEDGLNAFLHNPSAGSRPDR